MPGKGEPDPEHVQAGSDGEEPSTRSGALMSAATLERRPIGLMVPDGGEACADLRWYCKDAKSCTQRWTSRLRDPEAESAAAEGPEAAEPEQDGIGRRDG